MSELKSKKQESRSKKQYKKPPFAFGNIKDIRVSLGHDQRARRRKRRTKDFEEKRDVSSCSVTSQNNLMEYANQIQELTERSVSGCTSGCTHCMNFTISSFFKLRANYKENQVLIDEIKTKLLNWKEEQKKKKAQESKKKPPFIVGIVHHHFYSPVLTTNVTSEKKKKTATQKNTNIKKGITKATEKRLLAKTANIETKQKTITTSAKKKSATNNKSVKKLESFAPLNHKFNPPAGLPKILLFGEAILENSSDKNNISACDKSTETVQFQSVCGNSIESITLKLSSNELETSNSSQKEQINSSEKLRLNNSKETSPSGFFLHTCTIKEENCSNHLISFPKYLNNTENNIKRNKQNNSDLDQTSDSLNLSDKLAIKDIMKNSDVPVEEKEYGVQYFKRVLSEEKNRLQILCEKWMEIQSQDDITEDIRYRIHQAIGQTTMLIKEKFKQFHSLILDCERNDSDVLVTCMDLHGFWDMMYIEVKDCNSRFANLKKLRARCWQEDQSFIAESTGSKKKIVTKKKVIPTKQISQQASIISDRKKKMAETQDSEKNSQQTINLSNEYTTPCLTNKRAVNSFRKISNVSHNKRTLETSTNCMYTSTPFPVSVTSDISNRFSTPLITMKVSQLYIKSMLLNDTMLCPEETPKKSSIEISERPKKESLRTKLEREDLDDHLAMTKSSDERLARKDSNDHLAMTKSSDERLEVHQNSGTPKKINKSELYSIERSHIEGSSDSGIDGSNQTMIEKPKEENCTLTSYSHNSGSIKTLAENIPVKESLSNNNLKTNSLGRSLRPPNVNKIVKSPCKISFTVDTSSTPRYASLFHAVRNINFRITPDRVPKKRNSSIKRSWNKAIISDDTSKVGKKIQTISST